MPKLTVENVGTFDVPDNKRLVLALDAVGGDRHDDPVVLEIARRQLREPRVVLDQQHLDRGHGGLGRGHARMMSGRRHPRRPALPPTPPSPRGRPPC